MATHIFNPSTWQAEAGGSPEWEARPTRALPGVAVRACNVLHCNVPTTGVLEQGDEHKVEAIEDFIVRGNEGQPG